MSATPFTPDNCGSALDLQIAIDYFANLRNQTYTWDCLGTVQAGPSIVPCFPSLQVLIFCIGAYNQQHACIAGNCVIVDWTNQHATPCPSTIMQFVNVQPIGLATPCCDDQSCTTVPSSDTFTCSRNVDLWLCVVDGKAAECVRLSDNSICSGNLTDPVAISSTTSADPFSGTFSTDRGILTDSVGASTTSADLFSTPTGTLSTDGGTSTSYSPQSSTPGTSAGPGLSTTTENTIIAATVVPVVVSLTALVGVLIFKKKVLPACLKRRRNTSSPVTVSGGALTHVEGNSYTYVIQ